MAEANCSLCVAGKYHSGSGLNAAPLLCLQMHRLVERVRMTSALDNLLLNGSFLWNQCSYLLLFENYVDQANFSVKEFFFFKINLYFKFLVKFLN